MLCSSGGGAWPARKTEPHTPQYLIVLPDRYAAVLYENGSRGVNEWQHIDEEQRVGLRCVHAGDGEERPTGHSW